MKNFSAALSTISHEHNIQQTQTYILRLLPVDALPSLVASTFLICAMTSVESLLSCAAMEI